MPPLTLSQLIFIARQHYDAGRLLEAEGLCRKVIAANPANVEALRLAGLVAERGGRHGVAAVFLERAAATAPRRAELHADLARNYRLAHRLEQAVASYRRARELTPDDFALLCALAGALYESGALAGAIAACQEAIALRPDAAEAYVQLGDALRSADRHADAAAAYRRALALRGGDAETHVKLGDTLRADGRPDEAVGAYRAALAADPGWAHAHDQLGQAQRQQGRLEEAAESFERAAALDPKSAAAQLHLGNVLYEMGLMPRARAAFCQAITLSAGDAEVFAQVHDALKEESRLAALIASCRQAIQANPLDVQAHFGLGVACQQRNTPDDAIAAYRAVLKLDPSHPAALNNLGVVLKDAGRIDEALDCFRRAVELHPQVSNCHSNLLYLLHFDPGTDAAFLHAEHRRWESRYAAPLKAVIAPHDNDRSPERRLRIGYVSPNFCNHPVGRFMTALMAHHDHERFEIVCYASLGRPDAVTAKIQRGADLWVNARRMSDPELAQRVRQDQVDILVDLAMHMNHTRLLTFARKPAPIQMTYLAYCSTTGLETIDYRITDPYLDPPGRDEARYSERSVRLPETYWCYDAPADSPPVGALPALARGRVTFGSLNNFCKASPAALALWAKLLRAVDGSELIMHAHPGDHRRRVLDLFAAGGVDPSRVRFVGMLPLAQFLELHQSIDLALDPFPYPGGTTTCDALWMGVPTVSLVGQAAFTRCGLSIMSNVGLPELAVDSEEEYLASAVALAGDLPRLAALRAGMRERMLGSPLMDGPRFARNFQAMYRLLWRRWCGRRTQAEPAPADAGRG